MTERNIPFLWVTWKIGRRYGGLKLPPDWYWRKRYCARGECAYSNCLCPNGCPEAVFPMTEHGSSFPLRSPS